ncbi:MAG: hypothetical protein ACOC4C_01420, partial [Fibrobacterota bacterium]
RALNRLLNKMTGDTAMDKRDSTEHRFNATEHDYVSAAGRNDNERTRITHDDIVNLQIDLATINDSLELIEKM